MNLMRLSDPQYADLLSTLDAAAERFENDAASYVREEDREAAREQADHARAARAFVAKQTTVEPLYLAVWDDAHGPGAMAYQTEAGLRRDFTHPDADGVTIVQTQVGG